MSDIGFYPPSYRASQSDLTVAVSPLGLVELADEEFEVHGPRLTRYATAWAWYLGHHYGYRREVGEPQFAVNYVRALSDYVTNFCFGKGVFFRVPPGNEAIVPALLKRVWEQDNPKEKVMWEIGQNGGVTGDVFVKVAYEDPWVDPIGMIRPGRCRIIPLNPAHCFPEWSPHDRSRMVRFKLKYKFWGTAPDGTRQVFTYTELITETGIEEYVNDDLIDARPNPLGRIPIVFTPNIQVSGSPWGLSDIFDLIALNREYNEKALEISDIINYHSAPVTVITGAKATQLEKGPRKTWTLPKDAKAENLQALVDMNGPMAYMALIKQSMFEMIGVPEQALGQAMPISNTSGTALATTYQTLMNRWQQKKIQYSQLFQQINQLVILTCAMKEPDALMFNPREEDMPEAQQEFQLDPLDPNTYETSCFWPSPLPVDNLIKLNEIMTKMQLGLESRRGALQDLGEEFPEEKKAEIFNERMEDMKEDGALQMVNAAIQSATYLATGIPPAGVAESDTNGSSMSGSSGGDAGAGSSEAQPLPGIQAGPEVAQIAEQMVTLAYGGKLAQKRNPSNS